MTSAPTGSVPTRNAAHDLLGRALARCRDERASGVLRVQGSPGGAFHLLGGAVVAVESPGSPGVGTLLLRSGRIDEAEWGAAHDAAATGAWPGVAFAGAGRLGNAEFQVIHLMAAQDAVFAVLAGRLENCVLDPARPDDPVPALAPAVGRGVEPEELLVEAGRRIAALASLPRPVSPDRDRVIALAGSGDDETLPATRRDILECANGRRSPRDIAFHLGRGVWTVTVEVSRMLAEGLVETVPAPAPPSAPAPRSSAPAPDPEAVPLPGPAPEPDSDPDPDLDPDPPRPPYSPGPPAARGPAPGPMTVTEEGLPRRLPGASGIHEALEASRPPSGWKGFLRPRGRGRPDSP
ncbi:MarR family transcriptional regulator [Streptomyces sp. MI02-7b]|uniref:MarR family transcriptional regulator n=1 Tax=Streptomyces sp. MI02-7b TaxID=462941 RepID=UPI0029B83F60|nr:MarR family transcriptional regulator [Streptomyces sp. MI02-7b]MDX3072241.1 MarR family transcriptional regulator [Streptomyces sp. MI02-7b]